MENKAKNIAKAAAGVVGAAAVEKVGAAAVGKLVDPAVDIIKENVKDFIAEKKELVAIPRIYSKKMNIDNAVEMIESLGLKAKRQELLPAEAHIKYRNCFEYQAVNVESPSGRKVKPGTVVVIKYVTQNVIEKSNEMYNEIVSLREQKAFERKQKLENGKKAAKNLVNKAIRKDKKQLSD